MKFLQNQKDNHDESCKPKHSTSQGFPYWGVAPPAENLLIPHHQEELPQLNFYSIHSH